MQLTFCMTHTLWYKVGFIVWMVGKKIKRRIFCITWKWYEVQISVCINEVYFGTQPYPHTYAASVAVFVLPWQSWVVATETVYSLQSQNYLPSGLFRKSWPSPGLRQSGEAKRVASSSSVRSFIHSFSYILSPHRGLGPGPGMHCFWLRRGVREIFRAKCFASRFSNSFIVTLVKKTVSR